MMREGNHDLCGGVTELHVFCGRWNWFLYETCVTCDFEATDDVSIKVEEAVNIKEEVSIKVEEAIDIKDEFAEVRLWGVFEVVAAHAFRPFIAPQERKLWNYTSLFPALGYIVGVIELLKFGLQSWREETF